MEIDKEVLEVIVPYNINDTIVIHGFDGQMFLSKIKDITNHEYIVDTFASFWDLNYADPEIKRYAKPETNAYLSDDNFELLSDYLDRGAKLISNQLYLLNQLETKTGTLAEAIQKYSNKLVTSHPENNKENWKPSI